MQRAVGAHRVDFHSAIYLVNVQIKDRESKDHRGPSRGEGE